MYEVETEFDIGFNDSSINKVYEAHLINLDYKSKLENFKKDVSIIPKDKWNIDDFLNQPEWKNINKRANELLSILNVKTRTYIDDYNYIFVKSNEK